MTIVIIIYLQIAYFRKNFSNIPYSGKSSLVQTFTKMPPEVSKEIFLVHIFAPNSVKETTPKQRPMSGMHIYTYTSAITSPRLRYCTSYRTCRFLNANHWAQLARRRWPLKWLWRPWLEAIMFTVMSRVLWRTSLQMRSFERFQSVYRHCCKRRCNCRIHHLLAFPESNKEPCW